MPGRKTNGAKLPSEGLGLNASKSESRPDVQRYIVCPSRGKASVRIPSGSWTKLCAWPRPVGLVLSQSDMTKTVLRILGYGGRHDIQMWYERVGNKSFVDDLIFCRGDVSVRAATTLRDIESYP